MKTLHQQLAEKRQQIAAAEALVAVGEHLYETHLAKERLPRLRDEAASLDTSIELSTAAATNLNHALTHMRTQADGSRELHLAITEAETAAWRLRNHLGEPPVNRAGPPKPPPVVPQPKPR